MKGLNKRALSWVSDTVIWEQKKYNANGLNYTVQDSLFAEVMNGAYFLFSGWNGTSARGGLSPECTHCFFYYSFQIRSVNGVITVSPCWTNAKCDGKMHLSLGYGCVSALMEELSPGKCFSQKETNSSISKFRFSSAFLTVDLLWPKEGKRSIHFFSAAHQLACVVLHVDLVSPLASFCLPTMAETASWLLTVSGLQLPKDASAGAP